MSDIHEPLIVVLNQIYFIRGRPGQNDRPPLPAGHPITWGTLTANTCLENNEYLYPVYIK